MTTFGVVCQYPGDGGRPATVVVTVRASGPDDAVRLATGLAAVRHPGAQAVRVLP
ncbi:MAG: hypothetical protein IPM45_11270 [Acidimicrobiales bacterium]|nr:hypothetical protein [Acidimicrobiales bacterium]